ncbi:MAG TPA: allantoinase AllB [Jatrophihabitans sp.]|jgi:allantoinase|uniref:allantoinase AllB n=1 Tax=Jatrophihabitans sp. TaxID=1932789 RepID=UPI002EEAFA48
MTDLLLRARRMITAEGERSGAVRISGGRITSVDSFDAPAGAGPDGSAVTEVVIAEDCVLLPGLVDSHVHINEPGRTEWEGFASATAAAAAGGITTVVDMPLNSIPPTVDLAALRVKQRAAEGRVHVDVAFWGGAVPANCAETAGGDDLHELHDLHRAGVAGFKCFLLDSGVEEFPPLDRAGVIAAMRRIAAFDGLLIAHAEDPAVIAAAPQPAGRSYRSFVASRPPDAETQAISWFLDAVRQTGCRAHLVHLSSAAALPLIAAARGEGLPVTVETCPHYLSLAAEQVPDGATEFKCCPPIREQANREQLWQALSDGLIDCVVSDHSPCTAELKRRDTGDFAAAWGGIASLQLALPVTWTQASSRGHTLGELVGWMAAAPARLAGLAGKGAIAAGYDADFAVFAPEQSFTVDPARLRHRNPMTPYAGARLRGVVRETWLAGERIDGRLPRGRLLRRSESR